MCQNVKVLYTYKEYMCIDSFCLYKCNDSKHGIIRYFQWLWNALLCNDSIGVYMSNDTLCVMIYMCNYSKCIYMSNESIDVMTPNVKWLYV